MTFKERYQSYNASIRAESVTVGSLERAAREQKKELCRGMFRAVKKLAAATAVLLCICMVTPVLAAAVPPVYQLMYLISPETAQFFKPVQMADESQGIRMEVVSVYIHDNEADIYITMQDLEGDRIDESTDLYDSYHINTPFDCSSSCERVGYDPKTGTATFLITVRQWEEKQIEGDKITFSVREFISHKEKYEDLELPVSLAEAEENPQAMTATLRGRSGGLRSLSEVVENNEYLLERTERVLIPQADNGLIPVNGIEFTGMGYVNGMLHIQYAAPDIHVNDNHGEFFLVDQSGQKRIYDYKVSFFGQNETARHIIYEDCIFDLSPEELENYTLHGYFVTSGFHMDGYWSVTFALEQSEEK